MNQLYLQKVEVASHQSYGCESLQQNTTAEIMVNEIPTNAFNNYILLY
jgi:hypothetical protein